MESSSGITILKDPNDADGICGGFVAYKTKNDQEIFILMDLTILL